MGHHFSEAASTAGHRVTQFVRGRSSLPPPAGVTRVLGDRDGGLEALGDRRWDAVVDTSGYVPRVVGQACDRFRDLTGAYLFISSISVYQEVEGRIDENTPRLVLDNPDTETIDSDTYGGLKALCEDVVLEAFGERALIVRPGMIVGPLDPTDRFTYWVARAAVGGTMPAIGSPESPMQFIDARDLARWNLDALERDLGGTYNLTGRPTTLGDVLQAVAAPELNVVYRSREEAKGRGVEPSAFAWSVPAENENVWDVRIGRALATGLSLRPTADTANDTVAWHQSRPGHEFVAGLTPEQEEALLA